MSDPDPMQPPQDILAERAARSGRDLPVQITAIAGDLRKPNLGIAPDALRTVAEQCEIVVHAAAETRFTAHQSFSATNIDGTRHLLAVAATFRSLRRFVMVSSAAVVTAPRHSNIGEDAPFAGHVNEYVRTKREAETLVSKSRLPTVIARPSIVVSHGLEDPAFARSILWMLPIAIEQGWLPLNGSERVDIVPVNLVAEGIAALSIALDAPQICHLSAGAENSVSCEEVADILFESRYSPRKVRFPGSSVRSSPKGAYKSLGLYLPFLSADVSYDNGRMCKLLGIPASEIPRFTEYADGLLRQFTPQEAQLESACP